MVAENSNAITDIINYIRKTNQSFGLFRKSKEIAGRSKQEIEITEVEE